MNLTCLRCGSDKFTAKPDAELEQIFRGKTLKVITPAMKCTHCGWVTVGSGQVDELCKRTLAAFEALG